MRVLAITPIHVGIEELARRQKRYDRLAPESIALTLIDLPLGAPTALETDNDVAESDRLVAQLITDHEGDFDLVMPDCVLDPGVEVEVGPDCTPVVGLLHQAMVDVSQSGEPFGVIVRNQAIAREIRRRLNQYSFSTNLVEIHVLDLPFEAVTNHDLWNSAMAEGVRQLGKNGAVTVINGCSAVDLTDEDLGVKLIDPTEAALAKIAIRSI
jgi:Asp/Glu/hydantoin racemase